MAFLHLDRLYVLAGEGQVLRVFDHAENELVLSYGIFHSEPVHGIVCYGKGCVIEEKSHNITSCTAMVLLWGGKSISVLELHFMNDSARDVHVKTLVPESVLPDRILHGCYYHENADESINDLTNPDFYLVTAHNELISLKIHGGPSGELPHNVQTASAGPYSMLYSAHMITTATGRVLIAAGTFFGEIVVWSFKYGINPSATHHIFRGHQGSVFGVQISEEEKNGTVQRVLASCSDDRTIRTWDISETNNQLTPEEIQPTSESGFGATTSKADSVKCLATTMAHTSRIWGVRFLHRKDDSWGLLSYGEDATAQTWILCPKPIVKASSLQASPLGFELRHQTTYRCHSGKSIWAAAIYNESTGSCLVSTGGADGRITSYHPKMKALGLRSQALSCQFTIEEAYARLPTDPHLPNGSDTPVSKKQPQASAALIFDALKGDWKLSRTISDGLSSDPAGDFEGTATFEPRKSSDKSCDAEYLYSENGEFTTIQGLKLKANRQYTWRYSKNQNIVTVYFVKKDGSEAVDYDFHTLGLRNLDSQSLENSRNAEPFEVTASGQHTCEADDYKVDYTFRMKSTSVIDQWTAKFTVCGPRKNYIAVSNYTRNDELCGDPESKESRVEVFNPPRLPNGREERWELAKPDAFKTYTWLSETEFLASTEHGVILVGTVNHNSRNGPHPVPVISWANVGYQTSLKSSCIATSVRSMGIVLLTGSEGTIYLYQHSIKKVLAIHQLSGKLAYLSAQGLRLNWANSSRADPSTIDKALGPQTHGSSPLKDGSTGLREIGVIAKCLGSSMIFLILFQHLDGWPYVIRELEDKSPGSFVVTSSCFVETSVQLLILGSRRGQLAVYNRSGSLLRPSSSHIARPHNDAITSITVVASDFLACEVGQIIFATTGRDGTYTIYSLTINQMEQRDDDRVVELKILNNCKLPFGPYIEGAYLDSLTQHLFIWGFRSTQFVVWNESQKAEVLSVECGNAHRNWDYVAHEDGKGGGSFVFTKASLCCIYFQEEASHRVLQCGSHGREVKALALSRSSQAIEDPRSRFLATGAEDTAIRIFGHEPPNIMPRLHCLRIMTDHTTGIQQLCWSEDGQRLFSAAGREEFFVWRVTPIQSIGLGVYLEARCPTVTDSSDLRIMDFEVLPTPIAPDTTTNAENKAYFLIMAYSDSSVRVYCYSSWLENKFDLLFTGFHETHCLTQVKSLRSGLQQVLDLCTAGTNGVLALLQLDTRKSPSISTSLPLRSLQWCTQLGVHKNSIKSLDVIPFSPTERVVATGGDDGDIWLKYMRFPDEGCSGGPPSLVSKGISPAHATAVTGVACLVAIGMQERGVFLLASVGTDRHLKVWEITIPKSAGADQVRFRLCSDVHTSVADASSLGHCWDEEEQLWLYVAGVGMEIRRVKIEDI